MIRTAFVEMQCSKCKGTIAPGCTFFAETVMSVEGSRPPTEEERQLRISGAVYVGRIEVRLCYDCFEEL